VISFYFFKTFYKATPCRVAFSGESFLLLAVAAGTNASAVTVFAAAIRDTTRLFVILAKADDFEI